VCVCVWILTRVARLVTAAQRLVILHAQTYYQNKVGMNRHFQASWQCWASQPMGCLYFVSSIAKWFLQLCNTVLLPCYKLS